jgi:hypothetical protein
MHGRRAAGLVTLAALVWSSVAGPAAAVTNPQPLQSSQPSSLTEAEAARAQFGWPTGAAAIATLRSGTDVGTARWGIAMNKVEELDLLNRMAAEQKYQDDLVEYLKSLPSFGGSWIDQIGGGTLVVVLTSADAAVEKAIEARLPTLNQGIRFTYGRSTDAELQAAFARSWSTWDGFGSPQKLLAVGIDTANNRLTFRFAANDLANATAQMSEMSARLGVDVAAEIGEPAVDVSCATRDSCAGPLLAGINIYNGGYPSPIGNICTMGFAVVIGGDRQALTAGHCGLKSSTYNNWFNHGFVSGNPPGFIGNEISNQILAAVHRDIGTIGLLDSQASTQVFAQGGVITGSSSDMNGDAISVSLGWGSNTVKTGTVTDSSYTWTSTTCGCQVIGSDASWTTKPGDSGSPVYRVISNAPFPPSLIAVGINDDAGGEFAEVADALTVWGGTIYH